MKFQSRARPGLSSHDATGLRAALADIGAELREIEVATIAAREAVANGYPVDREAARARVLRTGELFHRLEAIRAAAELAGAGPPGGARA